MILFMLNIKIKINEAGSNLFCPRFLDETFYMNFY